MKFLICFVFFNLITNFLFASENKKPTEESPSFYSSIINTVMGYKFEYKGIIADYSSLYMTSDNGRGYDNPYLADGLKTSLRNASKIGMSFKLDQESEVVLNAGLSFESNWNYKSDGITGVFIKFMRRNDYFMYVKNMTAEAEVAVYRNSWSGSKKIFQASKGNWGGIRLTTTVGPLIKLTDDFSIWPRVSVGFKYKVQTKKQDDVVTSDLKSSFFTYGLALAMVYETF